MSVFTVHVDFMGPVLRPGNAENVDVSLREGATVACLLQELGYRPEHTRHLGVFRDGLRLPHSTKLLDGELLTISVPFGGG